LTQNEIKLNKNYTHIIILIVVSCMVLTSSCKLTKNLAEGDSVYMGTNITIQDVKQAKSIREFKYILKDIPQRGTENGIGNFKIGLHNIFETAPEKGLKHWVKYRLGSRPIIFSGDMLEITEAKLVYYLKGKGFFSNMVSCDSTAINRKTKLNCDVTLGERFRIDSLIFPTDTLYTILNLNEETKRQILKETDYYDRDKLDFERLRLTTLAGNKGYADFRSNNVHFYVDTARIENKVDIYTKIISPTDSTQHIRYTLDSILVYPNYSKSDLNILPAIQTPLDNSITIIETIPYLNHDLFERLILEDPDRYFNRTLQTRTNRRLQNLGLFQVINIVNEPSANGQEDHITQKIFLSPLDIQSVSGEVELNNRSGNSFGFGGSISYQNRNLFGHAEYLNLSLGGQVETQFGDGVSLINSSDFNASAELTIPRFIAPFLRITTNKNFLPRTVIKSDITIQRRTDFYSIQSITGKFGYRWRQTTSKLHELYPININEIKVSNETQDFLDLISLDTRLQRSFSDVLIGGLQYFYTYSSQTNPTDRSSHYFKGSLETSGNLLSTIFGSDQSSPKEIFGQEFAQFTKVTLDFRKYWGFNESDLAARIILGVGKAFGNSAELPYIKQYFVGGSNSLRAFRIRGLGPGSFFVNPEGLTEIESQFVDQTGDMKLEMNVEYRFPVFKYFKGALFIDAGNIWLIDSPDRLEENFDISRFYNQIAIGTGLGFRLDFDFFVIRLDIAFPLREPSANGFIWRISDFDVLSKEWRRDNLRYNLGIGYPF